MAGTNGRNTEVGTPERGLCKAFLPVGILLCLGICADVNSLRSAALMHHLSDPFSAPVLDNPLLRSIPLLPKLFTGEFLGSTHGEYRPAGYVLVAILNCLVPDAGVLFWHCVLCTLHFAAALLVFLVLRMLLREGTALGLAAGYLVHPVFVPLLNDTNSIYASLGLLASALTLWFFLRYLRSGGTWNLVLSVLAFAQAVFSFTEAAIVPALLILLCLHHRSAPRLCAAGLVYVSLAALVAGLFRVPALLTLAVLSGLAVVLSNLVPAGRAEHLRLVKLLPAYFMVAVLRQVVSAHIRMPEVADVALQHCRSADLIDPAQLWFVSRRILSGSTLHLVCLAVATLCPITFLFRRFSLLVSAVPLAVFLPVCVLANRDYRDDVTYWQYQNRIGPERLGIQLNLATAYLQQAQWEAARDLLMFLAYERKVTGPTETIVSSQLGAVFAGMGNDKVAGVYFFSTLSRTGWNYEIMRNLLREAGAFSFRMGYLSTAEYCWASGLVYDPYDTRLYNDLGRVLLYRNFFRAAEEHFRHVLSRQPRNAKALYFLAFIAQSGGSDEEFHHFSSKWKEVTGSSGEIDFGPVHAAFDFDREKMIEWFSDNPGRMLVGWRKRSMASKDRPIYRVVQDGKTYPLGEVPLEIGRYFSKRGNHAAAARYLEAAYEVDPEARPIIRGLADAYRALDRHEDADRVERPPQKESTDAPKD